MGELTYIEACLGQIMPDKEPFRMAFDLSYTNNKSIHSDLVRNEVFDLPFTRVLTRFLSLGDTFIDIGSHIGYYSLMARQFVGGTGNIYSFEPHPGTYGVLLSSIQLNSYRNIAAFNCAISDKEQVVAFTMSEADEGLSSLADIGGTKISVYSTTLEPSTRG